MPTPVQLKRNGTPGASAPSSLLHGELALNYGDARIFWRDASNVIQSFTFQSYALASHTHSISDVTGLQTALDGKASSSHTHAASDITSGTLDIARIANDAVTYAKIQNVSATDRLLGRSSAGAGDVEEITCTSFGRSLIDDADAATARTTLGVQPTASPAFTGAATFANTGDVVPLTVTNTGTVNSFVVNDASGDSDPFVIDAAGRIAIGATAAFSDSHKFAILGGLPSSAGVTAGFVLRVLVPSSSTNNFISCLSNIGTEAASYTVNSLEHYAAAQQSLGAGSAIGSQYGFVARDSLTGATNNFGFWSNIASGTGRWNFYANGTAQNYFGGQVTVASPLVLTGTVAGNVRQLRMQTSGSTRWEVGPGFDAESGSNVGSTFWVTRWSDAGVFLGTPISIARATGNVTLENQLLVSAGSVSACSVAASGDPNTGLYFPAANVAAIVTDGSERVRVSSAGNVTIGEANSANTRLMVAGGSSNISSARATYEGTLQINESSLTTLESIGGIEFKTSVFGSGYGVKILGADDGALIVGNRANSATWSESMRITQNREMLIGTTTDNGAYLLQVNSQIYATNATIATSDARFKTNVEALTDATSVIESLRPVAFDFIPQTDRNFATERQVGLIAQEAQAALAGTDYADSVVAQCGDHLGLAYEKLVPVLIKALQESNARIAALEERING